MRVKVTYFRLVVSAVVAVGCLVVVGVWWVNNPIVPGDNVPGDNITAGCYDQIHLGMTENQVEAIVGRSADHQYHPWGIAVFLASTPNENPEWEKLWNGKKWTIILHFDAKGQVCNKALISAPLF